ncbi:MAG: bifunctional chorismate mutase/prephenate dehydrogenase [Shewanella sp.]|nr:bifunctional chorismate mutase/prephenate dehydrogenase [Shewanella sp.]MCF1429549.1 bifunctional chorismate mutase/prephenate dehydrogenase [Shewanella sp.]MCF1438824.1 bifunctional chorismate mutase/prephenate dehydrogenase [Shewanella sp.]MCF1456984.1 bifunctional chorismate mutase/prephenate dehydrogenase [Shewanella sp.]
MSEQSTQALEALRDKIDEIDQQLLELIRKRLDLVARVGVVKHGAGLPIYAPDREANMLAKRRAEAADMGIPPQLIEDILRRLMRESYLNEKEMGFKQIKPDLGSIVIIGGNGALGKLFGQMLTLSGYQIRSLDKDDWSRAEALLDDAGLVLVSVPISITCEVIRQKLANLPEHCVLADLTSIKMAPLKAMLETHKGPVIGLHPMFGPDVGSLAKQVVVVCQGRYPEKCQWLLDQIGIWGARLVEAEAVKHDEAMQLVQAMRHFSTFVYGLNLCREQADIASLLQFSSPIYRLELAMVGRLFAQSPELYADIIFAQGKSQAAISDYLDNYCQALDLLKRGDRETFKQWFTEVSQWFGDFAPQFRNESRAMLQSVNDMKPANS